MFSPPRYWPPEHRLWQPVAMGVELGQRGLSGGDMNSFAAGGHS